MVHDLMSHKSTTILPSLFIVFMMADNETHLSCSSSSALQSLVNYGQGYPAHINYGLFRAKYLLTLVEVGWFQVLLPLICIPKIGYSTYNHRNCPCGLILMCENARVEKHRGCMKVPDDRDPPWSCTVNNN